MVKVIKRDNGDYFEVHKNVEGATLKYFVLEGAEAHLDMSMDFDNEDDAIKAADSFDDIKDLL